jgi:glyoxalase family protein
MTDAPPTTGLHHATNVCTDLNAIREFSGDVLGWHTVKRTRNDDDPGAPRYYFSSTPADEPETNVTSFGCFDTRGRPDRRATRPLAFGVVDESPIDVWREHLRNHDVRVPEMRDRTSFENVLPSDPGGLAFELATMRPGFGVDEDGAN